jgi:hypothetical protein
MARVAAKCIRFWATFHFEVLMAPCFDAVKRVHGMNDDNDGGGDDDYGGGGEWLMVHA